MNKPISKALLVVGIVALIVVCFYIPWNQVESNGTGDGLTFYRDRGYHLVTQPPELRQLQFKQGTATVQPNWLLLAVEVGVTIAVIGFEVSKLRD